MTMRLGDAPRTVATTTPRAVPLVRRLLNEPGVAVSRGATQANRMHLPESFMRSMHDMYGKSRLGRQELLGEFLEDAENALWTRNLIERCRQSSTPELSRVVIGVDPPASKGGDACGIVAVGKGSDGIAYNFDVDVSNRTVRAYGQLRLQPDQPRSRSAQRKAGKPDRLPKDHGGHFIGRQFGGPEISYNHFAQNARFNNSEYKKLENEWKGHLKAGRKVRVDIRADYQGNSKRPYQLRIRYYINGKRREKQIPNLK